MKEFYIPFPEEIRTIAVPAPASAPDRKKYRASLKIAEKMGIKVVEGRLFKGTSPEKYFSGSIEDRVRDLNEMISDENIDMILCARGGYGSAYTLPYLDFEAWKKRKKPLLFGGYSDITALHLAMAAHHIPGGISCSMFASLAGTSQHKGDALSMKKAISACLRMMPFLSMPEKEKYGKIRGEENKYCINALSWKKMWKMRSFHKENEKKIPVSGYLLPANLTLLTRLTGTEFLPDFRNTLLLLEEVGELPRKVDFSFLQLHLAHIFQNCAGIVLGQYSNCGSSGELYSIFRRAAEMTGRPVYGFVPFGHGEHSCSLVCGEPCVISEDGYLHLLR